MPALGQTASSRPNIVYILMDDLGFGDIGCYGQEKIETPHIDQLRQEGMRFTQHYTGSPVSAPARCVLMTGMHSGHAQIRYNNEMAYRGAINDHDSMFVHKELEGQYPLKANTMTIGRMMQNAGYTTVVLRPLMVVAGDHANNDMAGADDDSWKTMFEAAGFTVNCQISGLGRIADVQALYVAHTKAAIDAIA